MDHLEVDRRLSQTRRKMCSTWQTDQRQSIPLSSPHEILHLIRSRDILSDPIGVSCRGIMPTGSPAYIEPLASYRKAVVTFASQQGAWCLIAATPEGRRIHDMALSGVPHVGASYWMV